MLLFNSDFLIKWQLFLKKVLSAETWLIPYQPDTISSISTRCKKMDSKYLLILFSILVSAAAVMDSIPIVTYEQVKELPKHPEVLLIDVREPHELRETGKIPTSINIPLAQVEAELSPDADANEFKAKYSRDKPTEDTEIVFSCRSGRRSLIAAKMAQSLGYKNVKNYSGSWLEWAEKEGLPK